VYFLPNSACTLSKLYYNYYSFKTLVNYYIIWSIPCHSSTQLLDYHEFLVVRPKTCAPITVPLSPIANSTTSEISLPCLLAHQSLGHNSDEVLDKMCRHQSLLSLPKHPFPPRTCPCIICTTTKFTHPPRVKETTYNLTKRGQLLHIDFTF